MATEKQDARLSCDCPILVWMISLNREYTREGYNACHKVVDDCVQHIKIADSFRQVMTHMLPLLMRRHRRIPRAKWRDFITPNGKHWIEQTPDGMPPEKFLHSMIGYHLAYETSLCGMAMTRGIQRRVINIGLGMEYIAVERGVSLTPTEMQLIAPELGDEIVLRRLCIILTLKQAYIKAIGQPTGFDWARLEFNIPAETALGDRLPLQGWEFRVFKASLAVARKDMLVEEHYQCVCAFSRGIKDSTFVWHETARDLVSWVQFINIDQMVKVILKLTL
ncbi:hypothetical protein C8R44DRAFT_831279 [Mycena epipterygia]|nr:hypothetical protein C8R44DRAFT_831279 [Mycena epipterygia]